MRRLLPFLALALFPLATFAQIACDPGTELCNPLGTADLAEIIGRIIRDVLGISGVVALAMFVWGGAQFLLSQGNPDKVKQGKATLIWATIGLVVLFSAYVLV